MQATKQTQQKAHAEGKQPQKHVTNNKTTKWASMQANRQAAKGIQAHKRAKRITGERNGRDTNQPKYKYTNMAEELAEMPIIA